MGQSIYKRILLKLSGEVLAGGRGTGIEHTALQDLVSRIHEVRDIGVEVGIVIGGGNIIRGGSQLLPSVHRVIADSMGMLGTVINALALQSSLEARGVPCIVQSAIPVEGLVGPFDFRQADSSLTSGTPVVFAGGTGHPYFTTDTTAALRAVEIGADALIKGTKVDGVYSADPKLDPTAVKYDTLTYDRMIEERLRVMDLTAAALCMDHNIPLVVFNVLKEDVLKRILLGESLGTVVKGGEND